MATTRVVGTCLIGADWCGLRGDLQDVPFTGGGSCPATLPHVRFEWSKSESALTSGEQSQVDAARTMLQGKLNAEETCADLRSVAYFYLVLGASGIVQSVTAWLNGPTVAGKPRQVWARWSKMRSAFSGSERTELDGVVSMLGDYLDAEEPLP